MPIFDQSYRHYEGEFKGYSFRWWVITRRGIMHFLRKKWFILLLLLTLIPFLVRGVMIYVATHFPEAKLQILDINPRFFYQYILQQQFFLLIITILTGSGLIANDLRYNALQLYLSKPIRRFDYVAGKLGVISFFLLLITLLPALFLFIIRLLFSNDWSFLKQYYWLPLSIIAFCIIIIAVTGCLIMAISSLFKSTRLAAIVFAVVFMFSAIMYQILYRIYHNDKFALVSFIHNLDRLGSKLFGVNLRYKYNFHWSWSLLVLMGIIALSLYILNKRVRGVEVAK
jgi:ABC-type transport system involved in multi-copper enzyme maturation permease subunit